MPYAELWAAELGRPVRQGHAPPPPRKGRKRRPRLPVPPAAPDPTRPEAGA
jgi:hypothetical protein